MNRISYLAKRQWWHQETKETNERCSKCWLRHYDCYCTSLDARKQYYAEQQRIGQGMQHVITCMYYHYQEIGRSANTAHLLEAICPAEQFEVVIFGDVEAEQKLVREMYDEAMTGEPVTCVLYPSRDAVLLSDWIAQRPASCRDRPIRLVALDGTYAQASRQYKHLIKSLSLLSPDCPQPLSVVKLDLECGRCDSALAWIQHQPNAEKICTYQAVVMAMRQAGESAQLCASLSTDLDAFLGHILTRRIKFGKTTIRHSDGEFSPSPSAFVAEHLAKHPPPVGPPPAGTTRSSRRNRREQSRSNGRKSPRSLFFSAGGAVTSPMFRVVRTRKFTIYETYIS